MTGKIDDKVACVDDITLAGINRHTRGTSGVVAGLEKYHFSSGNHDLRRGLNFDKNRFDIKSSRFNSMESPSFHWIILLRRNNTVLDKTQYITRLKFISKKSPSIFYLLSRFENEEYKSNIISNPTIQSIQRNILANLDKDSKMNISNNYFTNLDNIKKNLFVIVPNINLKKKLESNEKIRLFDFKLQGIKQDKKEIKEPNKHLESTLKGKLKLSAFIFDREKHSFDSFTSSHPKRLAYSPVYIADFIDIHDDKKNNLEIRM